VAMSTSLIKRDYREDTGSICLTNRIKRILLCRDQHTLEMSKYCGRILTFGLHHGVLVPLLNEGVRLMMGDTI
jgi:hypothetical protein